MEDDAWRDRLKKGIEAGKKSQRSICLEAGVGLSYLDGLFNEGKTPTLKKLLSVIDAAGLSVAYVLTGAKLTQKEEKLLSLMAGLDDKDIDVLMATAERFGRDSD